MNAVMQFLEAVVVNAVLRFLGLFASSSLIVFAVSVVVTGALCLLHRLFGENR